MRSRLPRNSRAARACVIDFHEVLGGRVRCRRVRHTCTICSFPGYCLGLTMRQEVFFRGLTPFYPIYWPYFCLNVKICLFLCWQTTDNRRQTSQLLYPLLRMRARGVIIFLCCNLIHGHLLEYSWIRALPSPWWQRGGSGAALTTPTACQSPLHRWIEGCRLVGNSWLCLDTNHHQAAYKDVGRMICIIRSTLSRAYRAT